MSGKITVQSDSYKYLIKQAYIMKNPKIYKICARNDKQMWTQSDSLDATHYERIKADVSVNVKRIIRTI